MPGEGQRKVSIFVQTISFKGRSQQVSLGIPNVIAKHTLSPSRHKQETK